MSDSLLHQARLQLLSTRGVILAFGLVLASSLAKPTSPLAQASQVSTPRTVTVCALASNPGAYDRALLEIIGVVSHGFESFTLWDPVCQAPTHIWLEYGGTRSSDTIYCCGRTANVSRPAPLQVGGISIPLTNDAVFRRFDSLIRRREDVLIRATLVGRFFAGNMTPQSDGVVWTGYGHFGCCSLLAIQQVRAAELVDRPSVSDQSGQ